MKPLVLGLNHETAPLDVRERLAIPSERLPAFLSELKTNCSLDEVVALSTCNRTEIYAPASARQALECCLQRIAGPDPLAHYLYGHEDEDCARHLFRVASGLDSMVRGENEILGQVKQAYSAAQEGGFTGKWLNVLFQRSLFVGKRVRTETGVSIGAGSVGSVAVSVAERIFGHLQDRTVFLLGAGQMAELTAKHLLSQKVRSLVVANRTFERACDLAREFGGTAMHFEEGLRRLGEADIVISSTSSEHPVLSLDAIRQAMNERRGRPLFLIDISMPRNVEPSVNKLDNVYLFNLDDLKTISEENQSRRQAAILKAEELVSAEAQAFRQWMEAQRAGIQQGLKHQAS